MFNIVLSYKESDVLRAFGEPAKARAFEISSKTQMPPGEVTRILGKLAGKGFLKISESVAELTSTGPGSPVDAGQPDTPLGGIQSAGIADGRGDGGRLGHPGHQPDDG